MNERYGNNFFLPFEESIFIRDNQILEPLQLRVFDRHDSYLSKTVAEQDGRLNPQ